MGLLKKIHIAVNLLFNNKEKKKIIFLIFLILLGTIIELLSSGLVVPAIQIFTDKNHFLLNFFDKNNYSSDQLIVFVILLFLIVFAFKNIFLWIVLKAQSKFLAIYQSNLQLRIFNGYLNKPMFFLNQKNSSELINDIVGNSSFFCSVYLSGLIFISVELLLILG
jgi:ABC-type multidrug transport system fused ATPase/permease subunit